MEGWLKLHRKYRDSDLWLCEKFTRGQAWIDLLMLANFEKSYFYKRDVKINVLPGQVARSEVELADRWKWSRNKVRKFLNDLEKEQQIIQQKSNVTQILTIVNFEEYQNNTDPNDKDTDKDGWADNEEIDAGTNPLNSTSRPAKIPPKITGDDSLSKSSEASVGSVLFSPYVSSQISGIPSLSSSGSFESGIPS